MCIFRKITRRGDLYCRDYTYLYSIKWLSTYNPEKLQNVDYIFINDIFSLLCCQSIAQAATLIEVFQQALTCDAIYQKAIEQRLATKEGADAASLTCRDEVSSIIKQNFPKERRALLDSAERAIKCRFDLLGIEDLRLVVWRRDVRN